MNHEPTYVRIAMFEGVGPARLDEAIEENRRQIEAALASPPEGLEGVKEVWMLVDREAGRSIDFTLFETESGLRSGDEALSAMSPSDAEGRRATVGLYEVAFRVGRG
jgi:hypothetical protein